MAETENKHTKNAEKDIIYIFTKKSMCKKCKDECEKFDGLVPDCSVCYMKKQPNLSHVEAISAIRKAIWPYLADGVHEIEACESVLNALLGAKK